MPKPRAELSEAELEAKRAYDRDYYHRRRKTDPAYMAIKRAADRDRIRRWYPLNKELQAERCRRSRAKKKAKQA